MYGLPPWSIPSYPPPSTSKRSLISREPFAAGATAACVSSSSETLLTSWTGCRFDISAVYTRLLCKSVSGAWLPAQAKYRHHARFPWKWTHSWGRGSTLWVFVRARLALRSCIRLDSMYSEQCEMPLKEAEGIFAGWDQGLTPN